MPIPELEFDRRVSLHFFNEDYTRTKLTNEDNRWIATVWDKWNIMEENLLHAKTLDDLIEKIQEYLKDAVSPKI